MQFNSKVTVSDQTSFYSGAIGYIYKYYKVGDNNIYGVKLAVGASFCDVEFNENQLTITA